MKMKNLTKRILVALALGIFAFQPNTQALPTGLQSEDAKQITADNVMNVIGQNQNNVLNWQSFNIAAGETVNFTNALNYLNLVRGYDMSRIYGTMNGDGNIILINPNGILFGAGANINVGSLYASTRGIDDGVINQFKADGTIGALGLGKSADGNITMALANVKNADSVVLEGNRVVIQDLSQMKDIKMIDAKKVGIGSKTGSLKDTDGSFTTYNAAVDGKLTLHQTEFGYLKDGKVDTTPADYNISDHNKASDDYHAVSAYKTIDSASELGAIQGTSNASHYMLTKDIDLVSDHTPIGFAGTVLNTYYDQGVTFNGMGYTIKNLTVKEPSATYRSAANSRAYGFFAGNNLKDVSNLNFSNAKVSAKTEDVLNNVYAGVLAGEIYGPTPVVIDNVNVDSTSSVTSDSLNATTGGIVGALGSGYNSSNGAVGGTINNSSNAASVVGKVYVGGIIGSSEMAGTTGANLYNVSNTGNITATYTRKNDAYGYQESVVGGIAGTFNGTIKYAANTGTIDGGSFVGGIVGKVGAFGYGAPQPVLTIDHAYNTGTIKATNAAFKSGIVGGVVGVKEDLNVNINDAHSTETSSIIHAYTYNGSALGSESTFDGVKVTNSSVLTSSDTILYGKKSTLAEVQKNIDASMGTNLQGLDVSKTGNLEIPDDPTGGITPAEQAKIDQLPGFNTTITAAATTISGIVSKAEAAKSDVVTANDDANAAMVALSEVEGDADKFAALAPTSKATAEAAITKSNTAMNNLHAMADEATVAYDSAKKAYDDAKALNGVSDTFKTELAKLEANYNAAKANYDKIVAAEVAAKKVNEYVKIEDYAKWIDEMIAAQGGSNPPVNPPVNPPTPPIITPEELPEKIKEIINDGNANADVVGRVVVEAIVGSDKAENVVAEIDSATTAAAAEGKTTATVSTEDTTGNSVPAPAASDSGNGAAEEEKAVTFEG